MTTSNNLNWHNNSGYTEITALSLNGNATDEDESKYIIVHKILSENSSTDVSESEQNIVKEPLSQKNSMDISEYTIMERKEKEYRSPSVTKEVTIYFNIFEYDRNLLDRLDVTYQRAFMATPQDKYYKVLLNNIFKNNIHKGAPLFNENLRQAVGKVMEEMGAQFKCNINEITCDTSFQSPIKKKDVSTINDSVYS